MLHYFTVDDFESYKKKLPSLQINLDEWFKVVVEIPLKPNEGLRFIAENNITYDIFMVDNIVTVEPSESDINKFYKEYEDFCSNVVKSELEMLPPDQHSSRTAILNGYFDSLLDMIYNESLCSYDFDSLWGDDIKNSDDEQGFNNFLDTYDFLLPMYPCSVEEVRGHVYYFLMEDDATQFKLKFG